MAQIFCRKLHAAQSAVWTEGSQHQYNVVRCGRRWGKTAILGNIAISYATSLFKETGGEALQGGRVGIFTAEYKQQQEIFDYLEEALLPLIKMKSRSEGRIRLKNGGRIDFWVTNNNPLAGRGREYDVVLLDESAFTKSPEMLNEIWPKSIKPTLLTRRGRAWVFSTPNGTDENNFFYAICHDKSLGFHEHHAPTSSNPYVPPDELEKEKANNDPRVYQQEFDAEFIDWSADALLDIDKLLVDGLPVGMPTTCDMIFAVADTALKGGSENDGTGFVYFAYEETYSEPRLTIIDWDITQIKASLLPEYMPGVYDNLERLAKVCRPRLGSQGVFMEDAAMGAILNQKAETEGWDMKPIKSALTGKGKDERAVMASGHHFLGRCKITREAWDKVATFKQDTANHLIKQIAKFHLADPLAHKRADDLFDCYTYGLIIAFGNYDAL
ncbi:terminase [Pantoea sp. Bo_2]|uniref:terminase n=1 Tax=unclassified Pantoea TaxID=2630326 RepID=UPI001231F8AE|nr:MULTISPECIES: terminase [unclassified Pantoea]KAA5940528.1 terminase [Pantoea sp. VH_3]KAA5949673.1 terminase [Pantoea sp. VH_25]KAA5955400.1 terminase [Pantoea sp. VH_24]KAA5958979.1 terminase [Pantoea sp. VH_16]KAA5964177.1 terminase [Pantoea sp. VH_18]